MKVDDKAVAVAVMEAELHWKTGMHFECRNRELVSSLDVTVEQGGTNRGPSPKELIMNAMMGCAGMDVVSLLEKMRQKIDRFEVKIKVEKNKNPPVYFKKAVLTFLLEGDILPDKAIKAVELSLSKYCGVNYMISKICDIGYALHLNGVKLKEGKTHFIDPEE